MKNQLWVGNYHDLEGTITTSIYHIVYSTDILAKQSCPLK
jgi:hypothetical protein